MERKGLFGIVLTIAAICACERHAEPLATDDAAVTIGFCHALPELKDPLPDENLTGDIGVMIFGEDGAVVQDITVGKDRTTIQLNKGKAYSIFAFANLGYRPDAGHIDEMKALKHRMTHPYDYEYGIPMSASLTDIQINGDTAIDLNLERIMSKITMKIDRSEMDAGIEMKIKRVSIGNCPSEAYLFRESRMESGMEGFVRGFERKDTDVLNLYGKDGISGEISLFMLENMQGWFSEEGIMADHEKVFDDADPRKDLCSYIELEIEYHSDSLYFTDSPLLYRFYLGEGPECLNVERNCHYTITVCPADDGLSDHSWRVRKEGLHSYVKEIELSSTVLSFNYKGQTIPIEAEIYPAHAYEKSLIWDSSDAEIAQVDECGRVTAKGEGACQITCMSKDGGDACSSCKVVCSFDPPYFKSYPEDKYIRGDIGDTVRLWCEIFPPVTPFDVGTEYLEADKEDGIYDYIIDADGHGVTLILKGPGSGLVYMEAGEPVNESELFLIEVNLPTDSD